MGRVVLLTALLLLYLVSAYKHMRPSHTFHSQRVHVRSLPLGVFGDALVFAAVAFGDISEVQAAVKHVFKDTGFWHLAVLPQPRHFGSWAEEEEREGRVRSSRTARETTRRRSG